MREVALVPIKAMIIMMRGDVELNLAKCSHHVADLADGDLAVATLVVQQERFLTGFKKVSLFFN